MKILAVDDDEKIREILYEMLSRFGYECRTAVNGKEALSILQEDHFSIVISDIRMPEIDGMELLKGIKEKYPDIDVISITGYSKDYTFTDMVKAGASDFICKPFSSDELEAKIRRIVRERELKSEIIASRNNIISIFNGIRDAMYTINHDFTILSANKAFAESVGLPAKDAIGKKCYELVFKQDVSCEGDDHNCPAKRSFATGLPSTTIHKTWKKNEKELYVEEIAMPLTGDDGQTTQVILLNRDITARFLADKRLKELEEKYRTLFEAANDGIISTDKDGIITSFNKKAEMIFGYSREEIMGKCIFMLIHDSYHERAEAAYRKAIERGEGQLSGITVEFEGLKKDSSTVILEFYISVLENEKGELNITSLFRDITEQKRSEDQS